MSDLIGDFLIVTLIDDEGYELGWAIMDIKTSTLLRPLADSPRRSVFAPKRVAVELAIHMNDTRAGENEISKELFNELIKNEAPFVASKRFKKETSK